MVLGQLDIIKGQIMSDKGHWEQVYSTKSSDNVSWFQEHAAYSLKLIHETGVSKNASIIDVGGGASVLVDELIAARYRDIAVLDLSAEALVIAQKRLGERAALVKWIEADITEVSLPSHKFDVWHDRAVFHFLTEPADRRA
ncbi:MAG: ubiquinone/menaquinone biosynthesis C-methylase UbiE, partial [Candidatus Promineifilaceae bacterium]